MYRIRAALLLGSLATAGCMNGPLFDNPMKVDATNADCACENPVLINPRTTSTTAYADTFDKVLDVVNDFFEIAYSNRYDGRIVAKPTVSPGFERFWKPGSPDFYERTLVSLQPYRYLCEVRIREAEPSGYFVQVTVRKELADYPVPSGPFTSSPVFGDAATVDRDQFVIVAPDAATPLSGAKDRWIPKGRDTALEQVILRRLQKCQ
ncbi:hypothetical protein [Zavarzinella formosa]|uniref:hypothetical protein n=1 Tax=Zavarzinella formosa TaxID=360055 RepID=UPI00037D635A|nr:hypothetical protein [Zavarzinella formosa]